MFSTTTANEFQANWKPRFFTIWIGQAFSLAGSALVQFALVWWLTVKSGSATVLATATLMALLPQIVLGPFIGALVDRWNRRWVMIVADTGIALATAVLMLLFATGNVASWHIFALMFVRSLGGTFHYPAMAASTSLMVPNGYLTRVAGMNQTLQGVISIFAPPLGALLISLMPTQGILAIDIVTALLAVLPLLFIAIPQPDSKPASADGQARSTTYWQDLRAGLRYVVRWPGLLGIILMAMLLNFLLSPSSALIPLMVTKIFQKGAVELGWLEAAFGAGIITGGLILSAWGGFKKRILTSLAGIIGIGSGILLIGLIPGRLFWLFLVAFAWVGLSSVFANGPIFAIFQAAVDPEAQGRVFSLINAGAAAMMPLSLLIAGPVSDWLGLRFWYIVSGAICILVTITATFISAIMNVEGNQNSLDSITPQVEGIHQE